MTDIEHLLRDRRLAEQAFEWVETALERRHAASAGGAVLFPSLASGILVSALEVCDSYACRCGWNITVSGRDPVRRSRLAALASRPPDEVYGAFKVLAVHDGAKLWTLRIAGTEDLGLDAVVQLLLAPVDASA
ncbi:MAG: hypothetical protein KatS3mg060_1667 [Dehalococcoidia bacterium]|nr:MAG: hypothetical protein KatS3mg060_1667 [Dehalococcoidia bacterium]